MKLRQNFLIHLYNSIPFLILFHTKIAAKDVSTTEPGLELGRPKMSGIETSYPLRCNFWVWMGTVEPLFLKIFKGYNKVGPSKLLKKNISPYL